MSESFSAFAEFLFWKRSFRGR